MNRSEPQTGIARRYWPLLTMLVGVAAGVAVATRYELTLSIRDRGAPARAASAAAPAPAATAPEPRSWDDAPVVPSLEPPPEAAPRGAFHPNAPRGPGAPVQLLGTGFPRAPEAEYAPRLEALRAAVRGDDRGAVLASLRDDPLVASYAAVALMEYWPMDQTAFDAVGAAILSGASLTAEERAGVLGLLIDNHGGAAGDALLLRLATHPDRAVRAEVIRLSRRYPVDRGAPILLPLLSDEDTALARQARTYLARMAKVDHGDDERAWRRWWETHTMSTRRSPALPDKR